MNVKVFDLMSKVNERRFLVQREPCKCECRLNENKCNSKQKWNRDKFPSECKELDDWRFCKICYMWSSSTCHCECDKARKIG